LLLLMHEPSNTELIKRYLKRYWIDMELFLKSIENMVPEIRTGFILVLVFFLNDLHQ
jgi:hypothetical protein